MMIENEMPCFDPRDVLFITNKWDTIPKSAKDESDSDSSEDEETQTWNTLKYNIKKNWTPVKEDNIFRLSLIDVKQMLC